MKLWKKILCFIGLGALISGCDIQPLFWEQEGRKIVDDVVEEEERLHPAPALPNVDGVVPAHTHHKTLVKKRTVRTHQKFKK